MENKCPDKTLCMCGMNLNLCILRMFEDTFSLDTIHTVTMSMKRKHQNTSFFSVFNPELDISLQVSPKGLDC